MLTAVEQEATGRLATIRLAPQWETGGGVVVDLLFASSGIEREVVGAAARDALLLIQERGFQRGRDLLADLDALLAGR